MSWVFQESDPMGGAPGEAYANTLKSTGMPPEHVLAREAIQNSVDAGIEGELPHCASPIYAKYATSSVP